MEAFSKVQKESGAAARIEIVEALPETGESDVLYVVQVVTSKEYWKSMDSDEKVTVVTVTLTPYIWTQDRFVKLVLNPIPNWQTYTDDDPARILNKPDKSGSETLQSNADFFCESVFVVL